jgi:hypothetical protein
MEDKTSLEVWKTGSLEVSTVIGHQSSVIDYPSTVNRQPSTVNRRIFVS